jgi:hypothetical protein
LLTVLNKKSDDKVVLIKALESMWIECNILRRALVFMKQSFADHVSRAPLNDLKDKYSRIARGIIPMEITMANKILKGGQQLGSSRKNLVTIEDLVYLYIERETYKF